jgi:hypothetical protein
VSPLQAHRDTTTPFFIFIYCSLLVCALISSPLFIRSVSPFVVLLHTDECDGLVHRGDNVGAFKHVEGIGIL